MSADALVISYIPGKTFVEGEQITIDKLNELGRPTINLAGTIGTTLVTDNSITTVKLVDGVLSADTAGHAKMADGYFSADATGRAKFSAGFFGKDDAASIALFEDGFWDSSTISKFAAGFFGTVSPAIGSTRNLLVFNNASTPNSKVDVTADEAVVKNASGDPRTLSSVSVTIDITASGANGLDTGTEAVSTWYYVWLIYDGTNIRGLLSTSATAPTMPSGYTYKAMLGTVRNDASSNFVTFYQQERDVFTIDTNVFTGKNGVTSWTNLAGADLTKFQELVPPIAKQAWGSMGNTTNNTGMAVAADTNALGAIAMAGDSNGANILAYSLAASWRVPLKTPQSFAYMMANNVGGFRVSVSGYRI